jgi:hypothetical protein
VALRNAGMQVSRERIGGAAGAVYDHVRKELGDATASAEACLRACERVAAMLDQAFAEALHGGTPVACEPGCAYCCHLRVGAFEHEAVALAHYLRTRLEPARAAAVRERILANAGRIERMTVAEHYRARLPCALLVDGRCCAYEVRPSACAAHHSLSRVRCAQAFEHPERHGTPANSRPASLELQTLGDALIAATQSALTDSGRSAARGELHQLLRAILTNGDTADEPTRQGAPQCERST